MKVVRHEICSNVIEFTFDDGYLMTLRGHKQSALYGGDFENFGGVSLYFGQQKAGHYPAASNPKMRLSPHVSREMFMQRWDLVAEYFDKNVRSMSGVMRPNDIWFLHNHCDRGRDYARDGRRTRVGEL